MKNKLMVLVTRPKPLGKLLCDKINEAGDIAVYCPTITILPPQDEILLQKEMQKLDQFDWIIFVSPQAVLQSYQLLPASFGKIAAIGEGTANLLRSFNFSVEAVPQKDWNSEGLLALPDFQSVTGLKIAIIKGEGGREILSRVLKERGASVSEIIAYRRVLPQENVDQVLELLRKHQVDVIICTSIDGLLNLKTLLQTQWDNLKNTQLLVISERIKTKAQALDFKQILLAPNASDEAILATLQQIRVK